ncbi:MAG: ThuA domain-containing protein [Halanaerobiaceae bacterium]
MKKVLALVGDYYHPADYLTEGLNSILSANYSIHVEKDYQDIPWDIINEYDLFILAASGNLMSDPKESNDMWMEDYHESQIHNFVIQGGGLLVLHSGLAGYSIDSPFRELVKGHFIQHPPNHLEIVIKPVEEHEVNNDIEDFVIKDEQYFVEVDVDTIVFLKGMSKIFGPSTAGWAHNYEEGRVCCLTPGHTLEVLTNEMMTTLIKNAVNWCLNE